jgi:hypothetical protein
MTTTIHDIDKLLDPIIRIALGLGIRVRNRKIHRVLSDIEHVILEKSDPRTIQKLTPQ